MNKHTNKNKKSKPVPANTGIVTDMPDTMPREVAESMLLSPGVRLTNRLRKNCHAARIETIFCSSLEAKPLATYLGQKLKTATAAQLAKWAIRTFRRRASINRSIVKYNAKLAALPETAKHSRLLMEAVLTNCGQQAVSCDVMMQSLRTEAELRLNNK